MHIYIYIHISGCPLMAISQRPMFDYGGYPLLGHNLANDQNRQATNRVSPLWRLTQEHLGAKFCKSIRCIHTDKLLGSWKALKRTHHVWIDVTSVWVKPRYPFCSHQNNLNFMDVHPLKYGSQSQTLHGFCIISPSIFPDILLESS